MSRDSFDPWDSGAGSPFRTKLPCKDHMHSLPRIPIRPVQKQVQPSRVPVDKALPSRQFPPPASHPADRDVHVLRIPNRRLVHRRNPRRNCVPAHKRVPNAARLQSPSRPRKALPNLFHGVLHPLKDV